MHACGVVRNAHMMKQQQEKQVDIQQSRGTQTQ
jgi:hypothetical protein